jgi:hypothetical protein
MSMRYQAAIITASYFPLKTPDAPTSPVATAYDQSLAVSFTAPSNVGGGAITSYQVVVRDAASGAVFIGTGASSPVTVSGLTNGNTYTARVAAINAFGAGPFSSNTNAVVPAIQYGQAEYGNGTFSWVAPPSVTSVSVVCIGGGASGNRSDQNSSRGGGGGGLGYKNNITVVPGNSYTVVAGSGGGGYPYYTQAAQAGGNSYFVSLATVAGYGGGITGSGGTYTGDGGGNGGNATASSNTGGGGGGAGGYSGNGGTGGGSGSSGGTGAGGGGGGGAGGNGGVGGGGGGGTGALGQGANGAAGIYAGQWDGESRQAGGGSGGSGGSNTYSGGSMAGSYGGGGGGGSNNGGLWGGQGGSGVVRIIWPGTLRSFPSTNTGNL